eukprot:Opistho-2@70685
MKPVVCDDDDPFAFADNDVFLADAAMEAAEKSVDPHLFDSPPPSPSNVRAQSQPEVTRTPTPTLAESAAKVISASTQPPCDDAVDTNGGATTMPRADSEESLHFGDQIAPSSVAATHHSARNNSKRSFGDRGSPVQNTPFLRNCDGQAGDSECNGVLIGESIPQSATGASSGGVPVMMVQSPAKRARVQADAE